MRPGSKFASFYLANQWLCSSFVLCLSNWNEPLLDFVWLSSPVQMRGCKAPHDYSKTERWVLLLNPKWTDIHTSLQTVMTLSLQGDSALRALQMWHDQHHKGRTVPEARMGWSPRVSGAVYLSPDQLICRRNCDTTGVLQTVMWICSSQWCRVGLQMVWSGLAQGELRSLLHEGTREDKPLSETLWGETALVYRPIEILTLIINRKSDVAESLSVFLHLIFQLTLKNLLVKNLKRYQKYLEKTGGRTEASRCDFFPSTFTLPSEYHLLVEEFKRGPRCIWIMKPVRLRIPQL